MLSPTAGPFYRRLLPSICTDFCSEEGKKLFSEALQAGTMNIYFKLAAQFQTQEEPSFCGLTTLVMVLNALAVDPGRIWKGVWKWYHESMLDCCKSLPEVKNTGINFDQFACLAECNRLTVRKTRLTPVINHGEANVNSTGNDLSRFRSTILSSVRSDNQVTVVSYDRRILSQTGIGHFSPIGGYHSPSDKVLILDVARFKYPPHWVDIKILFRAMQRIDAETDKPRGYMLMSLNSDVKPLLLLQLLPNSDNIIKLHKNILNFLQNVAETNSPDLWDSFRKFLVDLISATPPILEFRDDIDFDGQKFYNRCCNSCECDLKETQVRILTTEFLPQLMALPEFDRCATSNIDIVSKTNITFTALFYSWPFDLYFPNELAILIESSRKIAIEQLSVLLVNEFDQINNQIRLFIVESDIKNLP